MGDALGDYTLEVLLGRGAMGAVYRAVHRPTRAVRALKVLEGEVDAEAVARFRREAEALARVGGDGVVPIHEVGSDRGRLFLALGFMPGGSLRSRVGRLSWREAVRLSVSLAGSLARCHAAGLVHRDLKPDNILFDEEDRPRLADFGLVRDMTAANLTRSGLMVGTPAYMAPEQLDGRRVDPRADVYALGCVLHEVIAGSVPLLGRDLQQMVALKKRGRVTPFPESLGVPRALDAILGRALAPRPEDRYPGAEELARDLERLLEGRAVAAKSRTGAGPGRRIAIALGGAALALGAVALALASRSSPPPPAPAPSPRTSVASVRSAVHATTPVDEATRQLRRATNELVAREPVDRVLARIDLALEHVPVASLPRAEVDAFVAECRRRVEAPRPSVLDAREADRFFRTALGAIRLARRFDVTIEPGAGFVNDALSWAHVFRECRDEDWCLEGLDAFLLGMRVDPRYAREAARGSCALLRRHPDLSPTLHATFEEAEAVLRERDYGGALEVQVEFAGSEGRWDAALKLILDATEAVTDRGQRQRFAYALQRAGWSTRTPVDFALLDQVVRAYRTTPEFFVLREVVRSSPEDDLRLTDLQAAARSELVEAPMRATAYLRLSLAYERRELWTDCDASYVERPAAVSDLLRGNADDAKRHARVLLKLGRHSEAGRVLEDAGGELLPLAREARQAKTPEARDALVEKLRR